MNENIKWYYDAASKEVLKQFKKRNITGFYCEDRKTALKKILSLIPKARSVGFCGSATLNEIGVIDALKKRGNRVFDPYTNCSRQESLSIRRSGAFADCYLASPNAFTCDGRLVFLSAFGNRISGVSYAENSIIVSGMNKLTYNIHEALSRAKNFVTPINCHRLNIKTPCSISSFCDESICFVPKYKRICGQELILEAEAIDNRLKVVLVGENLGF